MSQLHTCDHPNCGMKFLTQNGLDAHHQVHSKRKSLCLQLPATTTNAMQANALCAGEQQFHLTQQSASLATPQIIDETPTPSGFAVSFLRGYEELAGLRSLDELRSLGSSSAGLASANRSDSSNPFAETFKKATQMSPSVNHKPSDLFQLDESLTSHAKTTSDSNTNTTNNINNITTNTLITSTCNSITNNSHSTSQTCKNDHQASVNSSLVDLDAEKARLSNQSESLTQANELNSQSDFELFKQPSAVLSKPLDSVVSQSAGQSSYSSSYHSLADQNGNQINQTSSTHSTDNSQPQNLSRKSVKSRKDAIKSSLNRKPLRILPKPPGISLSSPHSMPMPINLPISLSNSLTNVTQTQPQLPSQPEYQLFLKLPTGESVQIPVVQPSSPIVAASSSAASMFLPSMASISASSSASSPFKHYLHTHPPSFSSAYQSSPSLQPNVASYINSSMSFPSHAASSTFSPSISVCKPTTTTTKPSKSEISTTTLKTIRSALSEDYSNQSNQSSSIESISSPHPTSPSVCLSNLEMNGFSSASESDLNSSFPSNSKSNAGRKARHEAKPDANERKIRCLERNREAAMRCRTRRKVFVGALEEKAEELQSYNQQLQSKVDKLSREVNLFKAALLSHKDCPVFNSNQKTSSSDNQTPNNLFDALLAAAKRESQNLANQSKT